MSRIRKAFERKAFIAFITCGDPDAETTKKCVLEMVRNGVDLVELGIPFSDPTAEGPVIMDADERALKNGITTKKVMDLAKEIRQETDIPLVFMTYANVVFSYGADRFMKEASEAGIDGLILPDVPFEEKEDFLPYCVKYGVDLVSMIAPTSKDRIAEIASSAKGFLYIVSSLGVTGVRSKITTDIASIVNTVREYTDIPCAVGFGISEPSQAAEMAEAGDGVIVGSAIVRIIAKYGKDAPAYVGEYVRSMTDAVHSL